MYKVPLAMKEIHEMREKHYEETKGLSSESRIKIINSNGRKAMKIIEELRKNRAS